MKLNYLKFCVFFVLQFAFQESLIAENDKRFYTDLSDKITIKPYFSRYFMNFNYILPNDQGNKEYDRRAGKNRSRRPFFYAVMLFLRYLKHTLLQIRKEV